MSEESFEMHVRSEQEEPSAHNPVRTGFSVLALLLAVPAWITLTAGASSVGAPDRLRLGDSDAPATGREIFRAACSTCHGIDGRGAPRSVVGFDDPLPDFTDCRFASREPAADWVAVAHEGGPVRGFAPMMPAFGDSLEIEELERAVEHVRTFCTEPAWPPGELNLPRPLVTEKAYPEDEAVLSTGVSTRDHGAVESKVVFEKRFGARNQYELVVPFGWREGVPSHSSDTWVGGPGDVAVAVKRVLHHDGSPGSILSLAGELILPTGDEDDGFGKGTTVFEPFLAYGRILPADSFVQAQAGVELPFEGDAEDEAFLRTALGKSFTEGRWGRTWSPMIELLGARDLVSGASARWEAVPQIQVTLNRRQHVMANVGVRVPLDGSEDVTELLFYVLWDWFDGGLFEGW